MLFFTVVILVLGFLIRLFISVLIVKPKKIREILRQQGIDGPPSTILLGNAPEIRKFEDAAGKLQPTINNPTPPPFIHNNAAYVYPFLGQWIAHYGPVYTFSMGYNMQVICVNSPELVKEMIVCTSPDWGMPSFLQALLRTLIGDGVVTTNGSVWARQRKIVAPEFFMDKVKGMMSIITESAVTVINTWKHEIEVGSTHGEGGVVDILVDEYMKSYSAEIISGICFGGSSSTQGKQIFFKFLDLQQLLFEKAPSHGIRGLEHSIIKYIPTKSNRKMWELEKEICATILKVVKQRQEMGEEKDLLQMLVEAAKISNDLSSEEIDQFIVDNCRSIYLAGYETSAVAASWCLMLLALYPEWQTRVRDEVINVCQGRIPDLDMLRKMKQLKMVIQETLRLYSPAPTLFREALKDTKIGSILVPKGVNVWIPLTTLHTNQTIWGPDALEFKPQRFENGIASASNNSPSSYLPFGFGPRVCMAQQFTMVQLEMLVALILSNFSFVLSPNYVHSPVMRLNIEPKHGVKILLKKL